MTKHESTPPPQWSLTLFWRKGRPRFKLTFPLDPLDYEAVSYFPNGAIDKVEHGTLDQLLTVLHKLQQERSSCTPSPAGPSPASSSASSSPH